MVAVAGARTSRRTPTRGDSAHAWSFVSRSVSSIPWPPFSQSATATTSADRYDRLKQIAIAGMAIRTGASQSQRRLDAAPGRNRRQTSDTSPARSRLATAQAGHTSRKRPTARRRASRRRAGRTNTGISFIDVIRPRSGLIISETEDLALVSGADRERGMKGEVSENLLHGAFWRSSLIESV